MKKIISVVFCLLLLATVVAAEPVKVRRKYENDMITLTYTPPKNSMFWLVDQYIPEGWTVLEDSMPSGRLKMFSFQREPLVFHVVPTYPLKEKLCYESGSIPEVGDWDGKIYWKCFNVNVR